MVTQQTREWAGGLIGGVFALLAVVVFLMDLPLLLRVGVSVALLMGFGLV